jgi:hypothetical protein
MVAVDACQGLDDIAVHATHCLSGPNQLPNPGVVFFLNVLLYSVTT